MSELIEKPCGSLSIRSLLLATVSAVAVSSIASNLARADDSQTPTLWIELGGQMDLSQGTSSPFVAPFMAVQPTPEPYRADFMTDSQRPPRHSYGLEGKITIEPQQSDWVFSAGIRYGRANTRRHIHHQTNVPAVTGVFSYYGYVYEFTNGIVLSKLADSKVVSRESHVIVDFAAGKDVGLGLFGHHGTSVVSAGVRFAQFSARSTITITGRPDIGIVYPTYFHAYPLSTFRQYSMHAQSARSFTGVGPSLSWTGTVDLLGEAQAGELDLDLALNAAVLFGRQKAKTSHETSAYQMQRSSLSPFVSQLYPDRSFHSTRSRRVTIPNLGGTVGLSLRFPNAKVSLGYRADFFFGAMDTGIDERQTKDVGFHGPFATISIGFGGQ